MPDKPATVLGYAAGASLAAITAFYIFSPSFFIDGENSQYPNDGRKRTTVGLTNPANDCFINSVLQALAGLGDLRLYLIKELHRRQLEDPEIYNAPPLVLKKGEKPEKIISLQKAQVTKALKEMIDALNERPIYKKTITARPFIEALERAFNTRISRNQQDAQEFLQIVLERLCEEYTASERARRAASQKLLPQDGSGLESPLEESSGKDASRTEARIGGNETFPFEGRIESQIQCQHCGFRTKPSATTFVSLTLNVPQKNSTSLDSCFDILLKSEEIDDYKCDKCRLVHAVEWKTAQLRIAKTASLKDSIEREIQSLEKALLTDPEKPPEDVELPDSKQAPKRKIRKSTRITVFPKLIAIHLSRSVFDPGSYSSKNSAKVSYEQRLRLGGILNEHWYTLLGVVCHKGSHNSGHYESFRRNHMYRPFATPDAFKAYGEASRNGTPMSSPAPSPRVNGADAVAPSSAAELEASTATSSPAPSVTSRPTSQATSSTKHAEQARQSIYRTITQGSKPQIQSHKPENKARRRKRTADRWWRISDEKVKEAKTSDVLGMQKEVYLLFYELERPGEDQG
ncbi:Ubiquitin carboxyl-terminal hydrolase 16 [Cyphellophora attinorum]|uniref:Ubiquitin carboxyl-terminal hydrolase n=1 Tax=Cyphellophora attinorum TaxID=1664694 RepID=A0A0N1HDU7_9EURO|nr:Ubiquitin carboxyl-terminal hydrolase 16 [Phialophora attinorum]KPI42937.1 Ubiquitin carboxyl-terminal hydrolase 16 [Phialophora attinorum]